MRIRCASCKYVRPDKDASERFWTAYECVNSKSEYYGCLLNITRAGDKQREITWRGCKYGIEAERRDAI